MVVDADRPHTSYNLPWSIQLARSRIFGKSPIGVYLRLNRLLWSSLPASVTATYPVRFYGNFLNMLARNHSPRGQRHCTFFLRNRSTLELMLRLVERAAHSDDALRVTVLGCSTGAEAYSIAWKIRSVRPELPLILNAIDISSQAVQLAKSGVYSFGESRFTGTNMFDSMTEAEIRELFDRDGDLARVKPYIKDVVRWGVGDATNPEIADMLAPQDIVVANNFLCHMERLPAEKCLHNIARIVKIGGHIFVSGIDLDIKTKVAKQRGWKPIEELLEEIHHGDPVMVRDWPFNYSSLEPLNKRRRDWKIRYAQVFEVGY